MQCYSRAGRVKGLYLILVIGLLFTFNVTAANAVVEIQVGNAEEFVAAIGSNRVIRMLPGTYDLSACEPDSTKHVTWHMVSHGFELLIQNVENLTIAGPPELARLVVSPISANVFIFKNCVNVRIEHVEAGHEPERGGCTGAVMCFIDCRKVEIERSVLYGSGSYGLVLTRTDGVSFRNSIIRDCTYGIVSAFSSTNMEFSKGKFLSNREFDMFEFQDCGETVFMDCTISDNTSRDSSLWSDYSLFNLLHSKVRLISTLVRNNSFDYLYKADRKDDLFFEGTTVIDNKWLKGVYSNKPGDTWLAGDY